MTTGNSTLITAVIVLLVVARFLARELRSRTIERGARLWGRPALLGALTAFLVVTALQLGAAPGALAASALLSIVFGLVVGSLVVRSTALAPGPRPGTLTARGSWITVAIWLGAFALRFGARFLFAGGHDVGTQMAFNVGALAMVTAAFTYVAFAFARAQQALAPAL